MSQLAWERVRLGDKVTVKYGRALPKAKRSGGPVPVYGSNGVVGQHESALTSGPAIILGRKGSSGAVNTCDLPCWPIDTAYYIDDPGPYSLGFLEYLLRVLKLEELDRSTAIPGLSREQLYDLRVPLPPPDEQDRIATLLATTQKAALKAAANIETAAAATSGLRQAVLSAACSGKLTTEWREAHLGGASMTSSPSGTIDVPEAWTWSTLAEVADIRGGIQVGASRKPDEVRRDVAYLRVANVQRGWLDLSEIKEIAASEATIERLRLKPGDILFNEGGDRDKLGRGWIWEGQLDECIHQNHIFRARLRDQRMQPRFFSWFGNTFGMQYFFAEGKQTVNLASLSKTKLSLLPLPVPSVDEQQEIVRRVQALLAAVDQLEVAISTAARSLERTSQAVLAKAFRGELTSTGRALT